MNWWNEVLTVVIDEEFCGEFWEKVGSGIEEKIAILDLLFYVLLSIIFGFMGLQLLIYLSVPSLCMISVFN